MQQNHSRSGSTANVVERYAIHLHRCGDKPAPEFCDIRIHRLERWRLPKDDAARGQQEND